MFRDARCACLRLSQEGNLDRGVCVCVCVCASVAAGARHRTRTLTDHIQTYTPQYTNLCFSRSLVRRRATAL